MSTLAKLTLALALTGACTDIQEPGALVPATVDEDPSLPQIAISDTHLHAEAFGAPDAPLVIVLHGGPGSDYESVLPLRALADHGYRVVFFDHRGTGLSQRHPARSYEGDGLDRFFEDLPLVIAHYTTHPDQPVVLVGHSWGAMWATKFINDHGDWGGRIKGAILSEPGAFTRTELRSFMSALNDDLHITDEHVDDATWSYQFLSGSDDERADYLLAELSFGGRPSEAQDPHNPPPFWRRGAAVAGALMKFADEHDFDWTTNLAAFPRPVLFLRGDRNTVATLAHQQHLAAAYPHAEVITIASAGHEVVWEQPDEYLAYTLDYFHRIGFEGVTP